MGIETWFSYGLFSCFATFAVYNGQRLIKSGQSPQTPWLDWVRRNVGWLNLSVFCALLLAAVSFVDIGKISISAIALIGSIGLICVFYVVRVKGINMREMAYLKIHLISFSWAAALIFFPLLNSFDFDWSFLWITIAHYLYVLAVTIPFDIRDLKFDRSSQRTIPQVIGIGMSKVLAILLLIVFALMMIWQLPQLLWNAGFMVAVLAQIFLVAGITENRGDIYCAGAIDGAIALLGLSYFL